MPARVGDDHRVPANVDGESPRLLEAGVGVERRGSAMSVARIATEEPAGRGVGPEERAVRSDREACRAVGSAQGRERRGHRLIGRERRQ